MSSSRQPAPGAPQSWAIAQLPGLRPPECQALHQIGIHTTADLLRQAGSPARTAALARQLKIPLHHVRKWVALADLARVPGVGCQYCGLLLHSGIISVAQLSQTSIHKLYPQLQRLHVATLQQTQGCPSPTQVSQWLRAAAALSPQARRQ